MARLKDLHHVGPFFSTDAGGAPNSAYGGMGETDGVPASTNIPGLQDFLGTISTMQVPLFGMFTPWGKLVQAPTVIGYDVVPLSGAPDTNIITFEFSVVAQLLSSLGFGQPGFLAIVSSMPLSPQQVSAALSGTPYKLYDDGLGVYSQSDQGGVPAMWFLYWIVLRDPGDTEGGSGGVGEAAQGLGATLTFAQQVPIEQTTARPAPQVSPTLASQTQFPSYFGGGAPLVGGCETIGPDPTTGLPRVGWVYDTTQGKCVPPQEQAEAQTPTTNGAVQASTGPNMMALGAVGLLAAVVGFAVAGRKRGRR